MFAGVRFNSESPFIKDRLNAIMLHDYKHFFVMLAIFLHLETSSFSNQQGALLYKEEGSICHECNLGCLKIEPNCSCKPWRFFFV